MPLYAILLALAVGAEPSASPNDAAIKLHDSVGVSARHDREFIVATAIYSSFDAVDHFAGRHQQAHLKDAEQKRVRPPARCSDLQQPQTERQQRDKLPDLAFVRPRRVLLCREPRQFRSTTGGFCRGQLCARSDSVGTSDGPDHRFGLVRKRSHFCEANWERGLDDLGAGERTA